MLYTWRSRVALVLLASFLVLTPLGTGTLALLLGPEAGVGAALVTLGVCSLVASLMIGSE